MLFCIIFIVGFYTTSKMKQEVNYVRKVRRIRIVRGF